MGAPSLVAGGLGAVQSTEAELDMLVGEAHSG